MLDLDAITRADAARRSARETRELIDLAESFYAGDSSYVDSRGLTGVPSNRNRVYRAHVSSWDTMARPGWSECISRRADGTASVFRRKRSRGTATSSAAQATLNERQASRLRAAQSAGYATELADE
jgi:hypothetical protein